MDWLTNLLKYLGISRSVISALFITSAVLLLGPNLVPTYLEPLPKEWMHPVFGIFIFTASLLIFWTFFNVCGYIKRNWNEASKQRASKNLDDLETQAILTMAKNPNDSFDLDNLDYESVELTRLEVLNTLTKLRQKELVRSIKYSRSKFILSEMGRNRALELQRIENTSNR